MASSDDIADRLALLDLEILRVEASEIRRVRTLLRELETEIVSTLKQIDPSEVAQRAAKLNRIDKLEAEIRKLAGATYRTVNRTTETQMTELASIVSEDTANATNKLVGFKALTRTLTPTTTKQIIDKMLVQGAPVRQWWTKQADDLRSETIRRVRQGAVIEGEELSALMKRVKGTRSASFKDGVVRGISERQAAGTIRTAFHTVANEARVGTYQANSDVVAGQQAINPLDSKTTPVCLVRSGSAWTLDGEPFAGSVGAFPGIPPWHWACRTLLIPILKDVGELSHLRGGRGRAIRRQLEKLADEKRVALDGRPAKGLTYSGFLKNRTAAEKRAMFGPTRYALLQKTNLKVRDLIDAQTGRALRVDELKEIVKGRAA